MNLNAITRRKVNYIVLPQITNISFAVVDGSVTVSWSTTSTVGVIAYELQHVPLGTIFPIPTSSNVIVSGTSPKTLGRIGPTGVYSVRVRAVLMDGTFSGWTSALVSVTTSPPSPVMVELEEDPLHRRVFVIAEEVDDPYFSHYQFELSYDPLFISPDLKIDLRESKTNAFTTTELEMGETLYARVRVVNDVGQASAWYEDSIVVEDNTPPPQPIIMTGVISGQNALFVVNVIPVEDLDKINFYLVDGEDHTILESRQAEKGKTTYNFAHNGGYYLAQTGDSFTFAFSTVDLSGNESVKSLFTLVKL